MYPPNRSHFPIGTVPVHITYRLFGSVPRAEKKRIATGPGNKTATAGSLMREELAVDSYLHRFSTGPMHLAHEGIRQLVLDSCLYLQAEGTLVLYAACVMSNHVHVIVGARQNGQPLPIGPLMNRHKRHTARGANRILGTTGNPFWETNYYDRTVWGTQFPRVMRYVLNNPVKAGLVATWQDHQGTYVAPRFQAEYGQRQVG